jgi:glycosyltransferase involved in cell wall biosynthesis
MRVCHIVPSLEERHGGPSKSVRSLANAQAEAGAEVDLLATQEAGFPVPGTADDQARIALYPRAAPLFLCRSPGLRQAALRLATDCIHHHSLWLLTLHYAQEAAHRRGLPLVISPRGMFSPWAHRHHRGRKWLAEMLVHPGAFARAAGWHATSQPEAEDIRRMGFTQPVCIAPNGVDLPQPGALESDRDRWLKAYPALAGHRVALFYSRFHAKKRVRELIELWAARPRGDWILLVAGIPEEFTVDELRGFAGGTSVIVADSTGLPPPYAVSELFLLPTHSENFGLVVAESLAAGRPALVTDGAPWQALTEQGAGRCVPWERYGDSLDEYLALSPEDLARQGASGRAWMGRDFTWRKSASALLEFYRSLRHG